MKYFTIFDSTNTAYAYTSDELGAATMANEINGYYREYKEGD